MCVCIKMTENTILIDVPNIYILCIFFQQGKPKNIWSGWQNRTSLEKALIGICLFSLLLLIIVYLNPVNTDQCGPAVHPTPDIYEETDSYVNTGQGETNFKF